MVANWLARSLLVCLPLVILAVLGCLAPSGSAMGLPKPPPDMNFTIAIEGAVLCRGCRYPGYVKSKNWSPLPDATALLRCRRGDWALSLTGDTDARGHFQIETARQVAPFTSKDCKVYVQQSPARGCGAAIAPRPKKGLPLKFRRFVTLDDGLQALYTAGNFVFGPKDPSKC